MTKMMAAGVSVWNQFIYNQRDYVLPGILWSNMMPQEPPCKLCQMRYWRIWSETFFQHILLSGETKIYIFHNGWSVMFTLCLQWNTEVVPSWCGLVSALLVLGLHVSKKEGFTPLNSNIKHIGYMCYILSASLYKIITLAELHTAVQWFSLSSALLHKVAPHSFIINHGNYKYVTTSATREINIVVKNRHGTNVFALVFVHGKAWLC